MQAEDALADENGLKGPKRIGVFQEFDAPVVLDGLRASAGAWGQTASGERVWAVTIHSPGAVGLRVRFAELDVPGGGEVLVYNADDPREIYGPFTGIPSGDEELWTPTCFSERVTVEYRSGDDGTRSVPATIVIDRVAHIYADFGTLAWKRAAGACNLDLSCYPEYEEIALGVGGIGTIGNDGALWCTGSLVVDTDPQTHVPYFITANHCVKGPTGSFGASNIEVYWLYQTPSCNGAPPDPASVPRTTGGADFLVGTPTLSSTDFTLLRLRNMPPSGLTYLGWTTLPLTAGTGVTAIHHPWGDFKRITFGAVNVLNPFEYEILWSQGTTEPGSSGSPLLLSNGQLFIGQLRGGGASCTFPNDPDYYGRFDLSYPIAAPWLAAGRNVWDVDFSGRVDVVDLQLTVNAALGIKIVYDADVDRSGQVDAVDVQLVLNAVLNERRAKDGAAW